MTTTAAKKTTAKKKTTATDGEPRFEAALPLLVIKPHPANPRRSAKADDEMVASVKASGILQPLVVAPASTAGDYYVISGHRRLDAARRAKLAGVPVLIRADLTTDAQQIEAAVVENVHRRDLSPIEEAEAFAHLVELKWSQKKISNRTGRDLSVIRDRLKLLKLSKKTQETLHTGQLTIGDAIALTAFDAAAQARLAKSAGTPTFKGDLAREKRRAANQVVLDKALAQVVAAGVAKVTVPKGTHVSQVGQFLGFLCYGTSSNNLSLPKTQAAHPTCLRYAVTPVADYGAGSIELLCVNPELHDDDAAKEKAAQLAERAKAERELEEEAARNADAATERTGLILDLIGPGVKVDPRLRDILNHLLPALIATLPTGTLVKYQDLYGIDDSERWIWNNTVWGITEKQRDKFDAHLVNIVNGDAVRVARSLVCVLLVHAEAFRDRYADDQTLLAHRMVTSDYFHLLEALGWSASDVDAAIVATLPGPFDDHGTDAGGS